MTQYATWASYGGDARTWLALGLVAAAGAAVLAGIRLPLPVRFTQPGPAGRAAMIMAWATAITALLVCAAIYFRQAIYDIRASGLSAPALRLTILPVTLTAAAVLFVIIISRGSPDLRTRLASAAIGAIAAPMIFELPFDPIVIFRIHTVAHAPRPWALVYPPLLLAEITTLLLLRLSPMARLTRATFFSFALMLAVWAAWALTGFGYPSAPLPIALNITSKILAFVAAFTLFLPQQPAPGQAPQPENNQQADPRPGVGAHTCQLLADMTPPPDTGGQINPFGMPLPVDPGRLDTDHIGGYSRVGGDELMTWRDYFRGEIAGHQPP
ncbi:hypothetical protein [Trebonia sp.]|uniref:hypothetical protein n=1 Tax=Trebonia sp. TaxID=2767075 RepID=UPI003CC66C6A